MRNNKNIKGFTLIEVLLAVALLVIVGALSLPMILNYVNKNDLDVAINTTSQALRRAQTLSMAVDGDSQWGVELISGYVVIYKGANYSGRDIAYDEKYDISTALGISGQNDISYSKVFGFPNKTGSITIASSNDSRTITLNEKGMVQY